MILAGKDVALGARVHHVFLGIGTLVSKRIGGGDVEFDGSKDLVPINDGGLSNGVKVLYAFKQSWIEFAHGEEDIYSEALFAANSTKELCLKMKAK